MNRVTAHSEEEAMRTAFTAVDDPESESRQNQGVEPETPVFKFERASGKPVLVRCQDEFVINYPCYFPLSETGVHSVKVGEVECVPILTDKDLVERFFRERFPNQREIEVITTTVTCKEGLLDVLRDIQQQRFQGKHKVEHFAFDPTGDFQCGYGTIGELIEHVEQSVG
jgi:hypothetical protein